ncbi:MAG: type II toxin-antitoxin system RelE/ParE family toxin [Oscillospiraceae bacterium]
MQWELEYYDTESGKIPVYEFLETLPVKLRAKAFSDLELLEALGNQLPMPYAKHIRGGIYELRVKQASDIARVFYFFYVGQKIILTNGFIKKTQKTPPPEIKKAQKYKADYERRHSK